MLGVQQGITAVQHVKAKNGIYNELMFCFYTEIPTKPKKQ